MKRLTWLFITLVLCAVPIGYASAASSSSGTTAQATMPTCKGAMVWAWSSHKEYVMKGEAHYGKKGGMYMCQAAANAKGYHHVTTAASPAPAASP